MRSGGANLEKVVDDEAMLTCEEAKTTPKKEALNVMSERHPYRLCAYPETPVYIPVSTAWNATRGEPNSVHD